LFGLFFIKVGRRKNFTRGLILVVSSVVWAEFVSYYARRSSLFGEEKQVTFWGAMYFYYVSITTIGYGDFSPFPDWFRVFTIFYFLNSIGVCAQVTEAIANWWVVGIDKYLFVYLSIPSPPYWLNPLLFVALFFASLVTLILYGNN
jgi:hypothetical protein